VNDFGWFDLGRNSALKDCHALLNIAQTSHSVLHRASPVVNNALLSSACLFNNQKLIG